MISPGQPQVILAMDTGEPEFILSGITPIGRAVELFVDADAGPGSVRFDIGDVEKFGPPGANAFLLDSVMFTDRGERLLLRFRYFRIDRRGIGDHRAETA